MHWVSPISGVVKHAAIPFKYLLLAYFIMSTGVYIIKYFKKGNNWLLVKAKLLALFAYKVNSGFFGQLSNFCVVAS